MLFYLFEETKTKDKHFWQNCAVTLLLVHNGTMVFESTSIKSRLAYTNKVTDLFKTGRYCLIFFSYHRQCGVYINTTGATGQIS
ncbi:Uncharacterized protein APZ42_019251 [Daphnia magna]|uniref:Uncharacterized protein n=1 Tax=Daphnia magna TaxID=35525 RepID=A0A162CFE6_9CRUS|nr:Uncharacterized protein APZ42_019251 [Daphnia magna]